MLKKPTKHLLIICMTLFMSLAFVGCGPTRTQLDTPSLPIISETDNVVNIYTKRIENASSYVFKIGNIEYSSLSNIFNATNIMIEYKTYYVSAKAIGLGNYITSEYSSISDYEIKRVFNTPILSLEDDTLIWTTENDATGYTILINDKYSYNISNVNSLHFLENQEILDMISNEEENTFKIKVNSVNNNINMQNINESEYSNIVKYQVTNKYIEPSNLQISNVNGRSMLSFNSNYDDVNYMIFVDDISKYETTNKIVDVTEFLSSNSKINVKIKSDTVLIQSSNLSNDYNYISDTKLNLPTGLNVYRDKENEDIYAEWNAVSNARSYTILLNDKYEYETLSWTNKVLLDGDFIENDESVPLEERSTINFVDFISLIENREINIKVRANAYYNFNQSDNSVNFRFDTMQNLSAPTQISVKVSDEKRYLTFNAVDNAKSYTIAINDSVIYNITSTQYDISDYLLTADSFTFKVKAEAYSYYIESGYSSELTYINKIVLDSTKITSISGVNGIIEISWEATENAQSYKLFALYNDATEIINTTENIYEYTLEEPGNYKFSIQAIGEENYISSAISETVSFNYVKKLDIPDNIVSSKDSTNLILSWDPVEKSVGYIVNVDGEIINTIESNCNIELASFSSGEHIIKINAKAPNNIYYANSDYVTFIYIHGDSSGENIGETYFFEGEENDYYVESLDQLKNIISFAYLYQITELSFKANFDYVISLTDENYYSEYVNNGVTDYTQNDTSIRNEIISSMISTGNINNFNLLTIKNIKNVITVNFSYNTTQVPTNLYNINTITLDNYFTTYTCGTCESESLIINEKEVVPDDSSVLSTEQLLSVVLYGRQPKFTSLASSKRANDIYTEIKSILSSIISINATDYEKSLAIYDYLAKNTVYNADLDNYMNDNPTEPIDNYYGLYIDGVINNNLANSFGLSKTFALMCAMSGVDVTYEYGYTGEDSSINKIAYNKVNVNSVWYVVNFKNAFYIKTTDTKVQYFNHNQFLIDELTNNVINVKSIPKKVVANASYDYYENTTTSENYNLVIDSADEFVAVISYYLERNGAINVATTNYCLFEVKFGAFSESYANLAFSLNSNVTIGEDSYDILDYDIFTNDTVSYVKVVFEKVQ